MSKLYKSIGLILVAGSIISIATFSSCKKDDNSSSEEEVCYTCTRSIKEQSGPDSQYFCDSETDANNTKIHYESQGYTCVKH